MRARIRSALMGGLVAAAIAAAQAPAQAALTWNWEYSAPGISAGGSLTTADVADGAGYFSITGISGQRNGIAITGLQPAGTSIPGNEPFAVDNLVGEAGFLLTTNGFGFALADGTYANPFHAEFLPSLGYMEFFSAAPFAVGAINAGPEDSEIEISFRAAIARTTVPEPGALGLLAAALAGIALLLRRAVFER